MSESTRRSLRTLYQGFIGVITAVPLILAILPDDASTSAVVVGFAVWVAVIAKAINALEDAGLIPAWLKGVDQGEDPNVDESDSDTPSAHDDLGVNDGGTSS
jgi:hypothetical protein